MTNPCLVCNSPSAQHHFGATVCRACAAFFRRYVHSKKRAAVRCRCKNEKEKCRFCRINKCMAIGMQKDKVQPPRDVNIQRVIKFRTLHRLLQTSRSYENLEEQRKSSFSSKRFVNMYEMSVECKMDAKLLWRLCETAFPEFDALNGGDKKILFRNFFTKWNVLEQSIFCVKYNDLPKFYSPSGAEASPIREFYVECATLDADTLVRVFQPYWTWNLECLIYPIANLRFDKLENMALLGIMLWDAGYSTINEPLAEICHAMRKEICRELSSHFEENEQPESNMFRTLDILRLIERGQDRWQEEMHLCDLYKIRMDEDFKNLILWEQF